MEMNHICYVLRRNAELGQFVTANKFITAGDVIHIEGPTIIVNDADIDGGNITRTFKMVLDLANSFPDSMPEVLSNLIAPAEVMTDAERRQIVTFSLANSLKSHRAMTFYKMVHANAFDVDIIPNQPATATVLFETASSFNHSCLANCHHSFSEDGTITITAARNVSVGDELRINYLTRRGGLEYPVGFTSDLLLQELRTRFGIACNCGNH